MNVEQLNEARQHIPEVKRWVEELEAKARMDGRKSGFLEGCKQVDTHYGERWQKEAAAHMVCTGSVRLEAQAAQ